MKIAQIESVGVLGREQKILERKTGTSYFTLWLTEIIEKENNNDDISGKKSKFYRCRCCCCF